MFRTWLRDNKCFQKSLCWAPMEADILPSFSAREDHHTNSHRCPRGVVHTAHGWHFGALCDVMKDGRGEESEVVHSPRDVHCSGKCNSFPWNKKQTCYCHHGQKLFKVNFLKLTINCFIVSQSVSWFWGMSFVLCPSNHQHSTDIVNDNSSPLVIPNIWQLKSKSVILKSKNHPGIPNPKPPQGSCKSTPICSNSSYYKKNFIQILHFNIQQATLIWDQQFQFLPWSFDSACANASRSCSIRSANLFRIWDLSNGLFEDQTGKASLAALTAAST